MASTGLEEVYNLTQLLESVRDQTVADRNSIVTLYSNKDPQHDARITAYSKVINVFDSLQLALIFISKHLLHEQWWNAVTNKQIPNKDRQIYTREFASLIKIGFVQGILSAVESSFRLFLRALDPSACNSGLAEFKSIYECLFKSKLASNPSDGVFLLDLLRLVRNTIHNNGVYFHVKGTDTSVAWKGYTYNFYHSKPVNFVTGQFLIEVSDALRLLLYEVVTDVNLQSITAEIPDPFSY